MTLFKRSQSMGIAALILGFGVFVSRLLGLLRDKIISFYFGASLEADIYFLAFTVPDFLSYLLAGGYFSITLIPLLSQAFLEDENDGWRFFSASVWWATLAVLTVSIIIWFYIPDISTYIAPEFSGDTHERLVLFLRIILPAQVFFLPGACFTALLYYRKQFVIPALIPIVYNLSIIICGLFGYLTFPSLGMEGFCWGVLIGAFVGSFIMPLCACWLGGIKIYFCLLNKRMKNLFFLALPLMIGQSVVVLDEQFIRIFGGIAREGSISLLNYARRIMLVPVGVVAQAAGLASFPFLASLAAKKDYKQFDSQLNLALTNTLIISLPISILMAFTAKPIMSFIFQQGKFNAYDASQSGLLLTVMVLSIGFWCVQQVLGRGFYAFQNTKTPAIIGTLASFIALPFYYLGAKNMGAIGVALASVFAVALYTILISYSWVNKFGKGAFDNLIKITFSSLILSIFCAATTYFITNYVVVFNFNNHILNSFLEISFNGCLFFILYLGVSFKFFPKLSEPFLFYLFKIFKKIKRI